MRQRRAAAIKKSIPEPPEFVGVKDGVVAEDRQILGQGLSDKHTVERVLMRPGEQSGAGGMFGRDRERFKGFLEKDGVETESEVGGLRELADAGFSGNFPCRSSTDENSIGTRADELAGAWRERGIIGQPPEQRVRIQKKAQKSLPGCELRLRERLEELRADLEFSLHAARLALPRFLKQGLKANERLVAASNDDLLAIAGLFDETREVRLCVMNLDCGHIS